MYRGEVKLSNQEKYTNGPVDENVESKHLFPHLYKDGTYNGEDPDFEDRATIHQLNYHPVGAVMTFEWKFQDRTEKRPTDKTREVLKNACILTGDELLAAHVVLLKSSSVHE